MTIFRKKYSRTYLNFTPKAATLTITFSWTLTHYLFVYLTFLVLCKSTKMNHVSLVSRKTFFMGLHGRTGTIRSFQTSAIKLL